MGINWNALVAQGRAKAYGIPWTEEEQKALHELKIPPEYVRGGCVTSEAYEKAKAVPVKPEKFKTKKEVQAEATALGITFTEETTRPELQELVNIHKENSKPALPQ